jgi:hypothetical protein
LVPDTDPTELSADALKKGSADVGTALKALREPPDDDVEEARLLRAGISAMRNFYSTFFAEVYHADVDGFGWDDKRNAVRAILERESDKVDDEDPLAQARYELATLFEDLSDELHGDVDFGYTDDVEVLRSFGQEYLQTWSDVVLAWLGEADPAVGTELRQRFDEDVPI